VKVSIKMCIEHVFLTYLAMQSLVAELFLIRNQTNILSTVLLSNNLSSRQ